MVISIIRLYYLEKIPGIRCKHFLWSAAPWNISKIDCYLLPDKTRPPKEYSKIIRILKEHIVSKNIANENDSSNIDINIHVVFKLIGFLKWYCKSDFSDTWWKRVILQKRDMCSLYHKFCLSEDMKVVSLLVACLENLIISVLWKLFGDM